MCITHCVVLCLIQVIGLTASVGVGKAKSMKQAVDHVLTVCANLDCQDISTVSENIDVLNEHVNKPDEGRYSYVSFLVNRLLFKFKNLCDIATTSMYCEYGGSVVVHINEVTLCRMGFLLKLVTIEGTTDTKMF